MIGETIKKRRLEKGLTLATLSSKSGVSISYLGRTERGERTPSGQILRKLAKPLGFTEIELFKLAGLLSPDEVDDRMENLKVELKRETARSLIQLLHKIDAFALNDCVQKYNHNPQKYQNLNEFVDRCRMKAKI